MPKPKRGKVATAPQRSDDAPPVPSPEKIPTYAQQSRAGLDDGDQAAFPWNQEQERALIAEGIWPERQWSIWKHAMQRGIQEY